MPIKKTETYQSYLLRCWTPQSVNRDDPETRRFMIERVSDDPQRRGFDTFEALVAYLKTELTDGTDDIIANSQANLDNVSYTVIVCVTDDDGEETCDTLTITINRSDPTGVNQSVIYLPLIAKN